MNSARGAQPRILSGQTSRCRQRVYMARKITDQTGQWVDCGEHWSAHCMCGLDRFLSGQKSERIVSEP